MPNDIVVQSDKNGGKVHLSADRVYDLNKNKTQDAINAEFEPLMQLDSEVAIVIDGRSCTLGAVSGQYVILQNSTIAGKSDGLYTVATGKTIPIGATNVTADMLANPIPRGGLNHLSESVKNTLNTVGTTADESKTAIINWTDCLKFFTYTFASGLVVPANGSLTITPNNLADFPSTYFTIGLLDINLGNANVVPRAFSTSSKNFSIRNLTATDQTITPSVVTRCIDKSVLSSFFS